jgi:hypothetical protein
LASFDDTILAVFLQAVVDVVVIDVDDDEFSCLIDWVLPLPVTCFSC